MSTSGLAPILSLTKMLERIYLNLCLPMHTPLSPIRLARLWGNGKSHVLLVVGEEMDTFFSESDLAITS